MVSGTLHYFGFPDTAAQVAVVRHDPGARLRRGLLALAACWGLAALTVLVPIAHFVLVPGFFLLGIWLLVKRLGEDATIVSVAGDCPKCGERRGVPLPELAEAAPSVVGLGRGGQGPGGGLQCRRGGADLRVGVRRERRGPGPDLAGERGPGEVGDVPVGGKVRPGRLADPVEQAGDRVVVALARAAERRTTVGEPAFDVLEAAGAEQLGEHLVPVVRAGAQERVELALGEQHHLAELTQGHAQEVGDQVARLVEPVGEAAPADPVGVDDGLLDQHVGLLGGEPDATLLGALPLR